MNYGLYLSASGVLTHLHKQDVIANNLANVNTVGFKADTVYTRQRLPARLESPASWADPQWLLEQLGGGLFAHPTYTNLRQGNLVSTGNDLDLAVRGEGFFVTTTGQGSGPEHLRLTRDGRLARDAAGDLVMAETGLRVLDVNDAPIRLGATGSLYIDGRGQVVQNDRVLATIQLVTVSDPTRLIKTGHNLMRLDPDRNVTRQPASGAIEQGYVEASAVDPIMTLNALISTTKSIQGNVKMMQYHDNLMGQAINTFGRVA